MTTSEIVLYIICAILMLIVGTNGIFSLVKWFRKSKIDDSEWKVRCRVIADLIEKGIEVPKDVIIATLRGEWSNTTWAARIAAISQNKEQKKGK